MMASVYCSVGVQSTRIRAYLTRAPGKMTRTPSRFADSRSVGIEGRDFEEVAAHELIPRGVLRRRVAIEAHRADGVKRSRGVAAETHLFFSLGDDELAHRAGGERP